MVQSRLVYCHSIGPIVPLSDPIRYGMVHFKNVIFQHRQKTTQIVISFNYFLSFILIFFYSFTLFSTQLHALTHPHTHRHFELSQ